MRPRFDYDLPYDALDLRERPELYRVGVGEQGVLLVEPYKSEILPHWRFRTPEIARASAEKIYTLFRAYLAAGDFVGADMARKYLQMGWTRARRYANRSATPHSGDKAEAARIFYGYYVRARETKKYKDLKQRHQAHFG